MKIACVTTTINVPRVLALYAKYGPDVFFFVVGDRKTDDMAVVNFLTDHVPNHAYYGIDYQYKLGYECATLIPENCIQRRSIGFLEALRWGADIVVSIDDDNLPIDSNYFGTVANTLLEPFDGLQATSPSGWVDVGQLLQPKAPHRGMPFDKIAQPSFESVTNARVGAAAGLCLGDPDIGALERISNAPIVHGASVVAQVGYVVDPRVSWTVWNSQNTAVVRDLVPAWFMLPHIGRADDIFASLIVQRVMRDAGYVAHFGQPSVWQSRNPHNLMKDLRDEMVCMAFASPLADWLDARRQAPGSSVLEHTQDIYTALQDAEILPSETLIAALAWTRDCWKVL